MAVPSSWLLSTCLEPSNVRYTKSRDALYIGSGSAGVGECAMVDVGASGDGECDCLYLL